LIALLLATVLAPSFSWEALAGQAAHDHDVVAPGDTHCQDSHDRHSTATDYGDEAAHHHHVCAGHMLSHLSATPGGAASPTLLDGDDATLPERLQGVLTSFPKRLDRPPHAPALA
jgi:hypothetical protein